ncbi:MAG: hypothetical protein MZU95_15495 [Desulfomicrobium escambiense]|nr:hypothetical protein [Desulfomicrobium escambiense]
MEEKILFPNALKRLSDAGLGRGAPGEDAIGFAWVKPGAQWDPAWSAGCAGVATTGSGRAATQTSTLPSRRRGHAGRRHISRRPWQPDRDAIPLSVGVPAAGLPRPHPQEPARSTSPSWTPTTR